MKYVDAGYAVGLGVLFCYAAWLVVRRHRLEVAVSRQAPAPLASAPGVVVTDGPVPALGTADDRAPVVEVNGDGPP